MHLSTVKISVNFGLDWHCPSISFSLSKNILYQPEKMLFAPFLLYILEWDNRFQLTPICCLCGGLASWKLRVVPLKYQYFDTVFRQWKCDRTITICVNSYRKLTVLNKHVTSDSTIDIGLDNTKPWIQAGTLRPKLDHNTGRHFDTPLRLVTSPPSFRQTRHSASPNISTTVHETS